MFETHLETWLMKEYENRGIYDVEDLSISRLSEAFGIMVDSTDCKTKAVFDSEFAVIFINENETHVKQRQLFFHEFGHVLRHYGDQRYMNDSFINLQERQVYHFSLYAAMPENLFIRCATVDEAAKVFELPKGMVADRFDQIQRKQLRGAQYNTLQIAESKSSYDPDSWSNETHRVLQQLKRQTGREVIDESLIR
ncbi:uncharacterized protein DUF955 [Salsuginibacillus halophilus]|uniref:Uncharacterized protein DUF955 n=1 Tax=Salsuginibacillus halophilus TaxID=517424 RepID=A0A2P8H6C1_9BACI|nr:ImmA/IrrE family metallo-endopeptidase [Salsuginibacillus halophilus]PSL41751.1 uncharacterized protein DUF955 [Salsuginibacillus halophilus]